MAQLISSFQGYLHAGSPTAYAIAFLGGLFTSFTPCTYPILPTTVGSLGSRSGRSRMRILLVSGMYARGTALTYAALVMAAGLTGRMFGEVTVHPLSHLVMGNVCIFLSLSL